MCVVFFVHYIHYTSRVRVCERESWPHRLRCGDTFSAIGVLRTRANKSARSQPSPLPIRRRRVATGLSYKTRPLSHTLRVEMWSTRGRSRSLPSPYTLFIYNFIPHRMHRTRASFCIIFMRMRELGRGRRGRAVHDRRGARCSLPIDNP